MEFNPYKVLSLSKDASLEDIKKRYKKLARKYHPDKGGDPQLFVYIDTAYKILSNNELRYEYLTKRFGEGNLDNTIVTKEFSPSVGTITVSFDYSFKEYGSSYFEVFLYNNTDGAKVGSNLVSVSTSTDASYSGNVTLSGDNILTDIYTLRFRFVGTYAYGASFDNISITEAASSLSAGTITGTFSSCTGSASHSSDYKTFTVTSSNKGPIARLISRPPTSITSFVIVPAKSKPPVYS